MLNEAVHTMTGQQPFYAFFGRYPARNIGMNLPAIEGTEEGIAEAHAILRETHHRMAREYRNFANRWRKNSSVALGSLVWVKNETPQPGTSRKLNVKWTPESSGSDKRWWCLHVGTFIYRAENAKGTEKAKPYVSEEWIPEPQEVIMPDEPEAEPEPTPPRERRPPRRYIEEC